MAEGNRAKTADASAVAILAMDAQFHDLIPLLVPSRPQMKDRFADDEIREEAARFNATLQAGYFILAIRAVGLAAGPMLGFDKGGVTSTPSSSPVLLGAHCWSSTSAIPIQNRTTSDSPASPPTE
jgi:nitroreductase